MCLWKGEHVFWGRRCDFVVGRGVVLWKGEWGFVDGEVGFCEREVECLWKERM